MEMANMASFGEAVKASRFARGVSQQVLAKAVNISQGFLAQIETGSRGVEQSPELVQQLESALGLAAGDLAQHLPSGHPARRMAAVAIPVMGVAAAGAGRDDPAPAGETLRVSEIWAGCVAYRARGDSMAGDAIRDGDYLIVRQQVEAQTDQVVVAWLADYGHTVKRYDSRSNSLRSTGREKWSHRLTDEDQILGVLAGVMRVCR